jgi:23S rRNA pseudouridine1911/1915/1917 synthase
MSDDSNKTSELPEPVELLVSSHCDGMRVDQFLAQMLEGYSRTYFQRGIREGRIQVNAQPCRPADHLKTNDRVLVVWPEELSLDLKAEEMNLDIVAEDDDVLVLVKPPNLVVHPAKGNWTGTLVHGLLGHDEEAFSEMADEQMRPGIVHRLDKDTSGVMVVAKTEFAKRSLSLAFKERRVEKTYLAIVMGELGAKTGEIRTQIGRHPKDRKMMAVVESGGKAAVTLYRVLATTGQTSLLEVRILTGRTHQIRVHLSYIHHPIVGDPMYGGRQAEIDLPVKRQMLHAWKLVFPHPRTGVMRQYMGTPPADFQEVSQALGLPVVGRHPVGVDPPISLEDLDDEG